MFEEFASALSDMLRASPLEAQRPLRWTIIANPKAGGFTMKTRWKRHLVMLEEGRARARLNSRPSPAEPSRTSLSLPSEGPRKGLLLTRAQGHGGEICRALLDEIAQDEGQERPFHLIICAGGDGTSREVMEQLYQAPASIREHLAILRLPMGTGNDGADAWDLDRALQLINDKAEVRKQRAVVLKNKGGERTFLAFNILSVGLDAFVTHMTNRMKSRFPGDSYKLWIDLAALFYDKLYTVGYLDVRSRDAQGKETLAFKEKLLLVAMGESGRRSYGAHKWILPDERNVCAITQMPLHRKIALKGLLAYGTHMDHKEALLWNAHGLEIYSEHPMLAQMDGETASLGKEDFPVNISLSEPVIPILKLLP
ncbi:MAG: diacylglycerol kinase [Treponema sp.]|nr:diacylglycerol kinase [Treponema sp.]